VLAQTFQDFEIILVDDGSTDSGVDIAINFIADQATYCVLRQTNAGVSAARNAGISASRGIWVAFLDADDYWHPEYLHTLNSLIEGYPEVDMVATNLRTVPDSSDWSPEPWSAIDSHDPNEVIDNLYTRWFQGIPFITSSVAVRNIRLQSLQPCFFSGESNGEDIDLWFRLCEITAIVRSPRALLAYREAPVGGLTSKIPILAEAPFLSRIQRRAHEPKTPKAKRAELIQFVARQRVSIARKHLEYGQRFTAAKLLAKAWPTMLSRRWFTSVLMTVACPPSVVKRWNEWRYLRKAVRG
jgi:glycosyltransferase involved in cell wall biosynthesis